MRMSCRTWWIPLRLFACSLRRGEKWISLVLEGAGRASEHRSGCRAQSSLFTSLVFPTFLFLFRLFHFFNSSFSFFLSFSLSLFLFSDAGTKWGFLSSFGVFKGLFEERRIKKKQGCLLCTTPLVCRASGKRNSPSPLSRPTDCQTDKSTERRKA